MLETGYIRLYRSLLGWEWYQDQNTKAVFLHLLLTANYEPQKWQGVMVERGQKITSYNALASEIGISVQSIRTAIKHLISTGEITYKTTSKYGLVTVKNYDLYQQPTDKLTVDQQSTNSRPTVDQQSANNNERKNNKAKKEKESNNIGGVGDVPTEPPPKQKPEKQSFGEFGRVKLTVEEYNKLAQRLGKGQLAEYIVRLDGYLESSGKRYKSHYATILNWWRKDGGKDAICLGNSDGDLCSENPWGYGSH